MARSRVIKPEFWSDEKLARVSREARLLYIGLWSTCDDAGRTKGHRLAQVADIPLRRPFAGADRGVALRASSTCAAYSPIRSTASSTTSSPAS